MERELGRKMLSARPTVSSCSGCPGGHLVRSAGPSSLPIGSVRDLNEADSHAESLTLGL